MTKMKPYIKIWYDDLAKGKIMGTKCKRCGAYEFPPLPVCNKCSCTDMEYVEMSGEGNMIGYSYQPMGAFPYIEDEVTAIAVELKEGPQFLSLLLDHEDDMGEDLISKLPIPVKAEVVKLDEGIFYPYFRIKE